MSASWLACALTLDRWVPKWAPFFTLFWAPSCATASSRSCRSDQQILKAVKTPGALCSQFDHYACFPASFSLLSFLLTAAFTIIMAKGKVTAEELLARAEFNRYKRGVHREKDSARDDRKHNKKTKTNQI